VTEIWNDRAQAYVDSDAHREGEDLDWIVAAASGAQKALDVATGGGHVARRLREAGLDVVTADPAPGMHPDVICRAEDLPFAEASFDVVACRTAAHHFGDFPGAIREMTRVARDAVLLVDTTFMSDAVEEAEMVRDPSHVRNYDEHEWHAVVEQARLVIADVRFFEHSFDLAAWLARTGCEGAEAERAVALLGERAKDGQLTLRKIAIHGRKA
jgi:ubiquinone/menaquinone biosynthesis C-methylase UbiE